MCWWILAVGATVVDCGGEEVFETNAEGKGRREKCFTGGGGGSSGKELNLVLFFGFGPICLVLRVLVKVILRLNL